MLIRDRCVLTHWCAYTRGKINHTHRHTQKGAHIHAHTHTDTEAHTHTRRHKHTHKEGYRHTHTHARCGCVCACMRRFLCLLHSNAREHTETEMGPLSGPALSGF